MGGAGIAVGALVGIGASYMGYRNTASAMAQQGQMAMQTAQMQASMYSMQSAFQAQQASSLMALSGAFVNQAGSYMQQAQIAARTGELLQANELFKATQAQREADEQSRKSAELRRQLVGTAKTQFAANGVLLESRPQSAVAMWEQDEATDLAYELSGIKRAVDNEVWGYIWNGSQARLQGLYNAQALKLQADGSMIEAGNQSINAQGAMAQSRIGQINAQSAIMQWQAAQAQANAASQASLWNFIGSLGGIGMSAGTYFAGTGSTAATGATAAPPTGMLSPAYMP